MSEYDLMQRVEALVQEHGTKWKALTEILRGEGFTQDDGAPLSVQVVRGQYKRWRRGSEGAQKSEERRRLQKGVLGREPNAEETVALAVTRQASEHTAEAMVPVSKLLELFKGTIERRDAMLAQKLEAGDEKEYAEDRIATMEERIEERLVRRLKEELIKLTKEFVDQGFRSMVAPGGPFETDLKPMIVKLIKGEASGQLISLLDGIDISHEHRGGPGRGHKDARAARFSATMDVETYSRMKILGGTFSSHLTAACQLYLRAMESKRQHTR